MDAADTLTAQRRTLPDSPGVYLFKDAKRQGHLRRQGALDQEAGGRALLQARRRAGLGGHGRRRSPRWTSSPPRPRPRRCSPSSASSASTGRSSTSACATTSRTPTSGSRWTRTSRASTSRASGTGAAAPTSGPSATPSACARRWTCSGKIFQHRTCDGPEPGRASGSPCLDYYIKRCQAPCVGLHLEGGVPGEHRHDHRLPLGSLPPDRAGAGGAG